MSVPRARAFGGSGRLTRDAWPGLSSQSRRLLEQSPTQLAGQGLLLMEIGADQGQAVQAMAQEAFPAAAASVLKDLAGLDRVVRVDSSSKT